MRPNPQKLTSTVSRRPLPAAKAMDKGERRVWERGQSSTWVVVAQAGKIFATLPYPVSANDYWRTRIAGSGKKAFVTTYLSEAAADYKSIVSKLFYGAEAMRMTGPVVFTARFYRPQKSGDLDNRVKPLLDALTGRAWGDDRQVVEMHLYLFDDPANPRVEITITPHAAANGVLEFE